MTGNSLQLAVIVGSVRPGRFAPVVANWFVGRAEQRDEVKIDVIDLADCLLPSAGEASPVVAGDYAAFDVGQFASRIGAADAVVVVTPEYNHGYPGPLKHAIDSVHREWHAKPVAFVSYGGLSGGLRAVEQLAWWVNTLRENRSTHRYPS